MIRIVAAIAAFVGVAVHGPAQAQDYPTKPVTIMVGLTPGSLADLGARMYGEIVARALGQRVVVENRPGAGGLISAEAVATAAPDGHTLLLTLNTVHEAFPFMQKMAFDGVKDFAFITPLFFNTNYFVVPSTSPANSLADLVKLGKEKQGGITFGTPALNSPSHFMGSLLGMQSGARVEVVPYRGAPELNTDLIEGRVDSAVASYPNFRATVERVKLLAVNDSVRSQRFPNVPTLAQAGYGEVSLESWFGLAAPARTPQAVIDRLHTEFVKASRDPDLVKKLTDQDIRIATLTPAETLAKVNANRAKFSKVIEALGLQVK